MRAGGFVGGCRGRRRANEPEEEGKGRRSRVSQYGLEMTVTQGSQEAREVKVKIAGRRKIDAHQWSWRTCRTSWSTGFCCARRCQPCPYLE